MAVRGMSRRIVRLVGAMWLSAIAASWGAAAKGGSPLDGIKNGLNRIGSAFSPSGSATTADAPPEKDAVSLQTPATPGAELYVAIARLHEQAGRLPEAETHYQAALNRAPNDLSALLGYARLKSALGQHDAAIELYQRAAKAHPGEAAVFNNLGLCYAQQGRLDLAAESMHRAVQLQPRNPLYRNNIAAVLVDLGRPDDALGHLRAVHGDAVAYYNLGYLLNKKGDTGQAIRLFTLALKADPTLTPARDWLERLDPEAARRAETAQPSSPLRLGSRPGWPFAPSEGRSAPNPPVLERRSDSVPPRPALPPTAGPEGSRGVDRADLRRLPPTDRPGDGAFDAAPLPPPIRPPMR